METLFLDTNRLSILLFINFLEIGSENYYRRVVSDRRWSTSIQKGNRCPNGVNSYPLLRLVQDWRSLTSGDLPFNKYHSRSYSHTRYEIVFVFQKLIGPQCNRIPSDGSCHANSELKEEMLPMSSHLK